MVADILATSVLILSGLVIAFAGAWLYHLAIQVTGFLGGFLVAFGMLEPASAIIAILAGLIGGVLGAAILWGLFVWSILAPGIISGVVAGGLLFGLAPFKASITGFITLFGLVLAGIPLAGLIIALYLFAVLATKSLGNEELLDRLLQFGTVIDFLNTGAERSFKEGIQEYSRASAAALTAVISLGLLMILFAGPGMLIGAMSMLFNFAPVEPAGIAVLAGAGIGGYIAWKLHLFMTAFVTAILGSIIVVLGISEGRLSGLQNSGELFGAISLLGLIVQLVGMKYGPEPDIEEENGQARKNEESIKK